MILLFSAPQGASEAAIEIWQLLNEGLAAFEDSSRSEAVGFINGIKESIAYNETFLKTASDEEIRQAVTNPDGTESIPTEDLREYMKVNLQTMKDWVKAYKYVA